MGVSRAEEGVTAIKLLQRSAGEVSDESEESDDDELEGVLVSGEKFDELAFERLMASAIEQPRYVRALKCPLPVPGARINLRGLGNKLWKEI